ncbi:hypothetical protein BT63DRAFT_411115 [Microthyrium microscopicum]|uniref:Nucleoside diphosphatase n=1 Tax=Microthyrium microscopicum TaxID=703497 RepID=A0A6A6UJ90_9PEZI|nr:hypothetical protein BT63DRAFT_411115 [Microthyrium microscopicum]
MAKWRYGVILDAGSSGTRVYVYRWHDPSWSRKKGHDLNALPEIETKKKWTLKTHPGVSTFGPTPESVGTDHLKPLLDHALKHVPKNQVKDTPLFLLATAGMRLLPQIQREQVLDSICSFAREYSDFQIPDCDLHIQVIPGETEGLYGWIAANYLLGGFDNPEEHNHGKGHHTYGFLDMGGASAQIAFVPNVTETQKHANDLKLLRLRQLSGRDDEYQVFTSTWLGFGANQARSRYVDALRESTDPYIIELPDPCLPKGLKLTTDGTPVKDKAEGQILLGTGDFAQCLRQTNPLLEKEKPCNDEPCLLGGMHVPAIDFDVNHFVGVSEYWHTTHEIFEMGYKEKAYDFNTYQTRVNDFCSKPWEEIAKGINAHQWGKDVDEGIADQICFKASWLINMLHDGIGIPRVGLEGVPDSKNVTKEIINSAKSKGFLNPFQAVNKIEGTEVSWTLGKMVLYASSEVPMPEGAHPVGFGSNIPGIAMPQDFQRPSGNKGLIAEADDLFDSLFDDSPRRIPGLLLFLLILCVAALLLCGRDRRTRILSRVFTAFGCGGASRRKHSSGGSPSRLSKIFGLAPAYERVSGANAAEAAEFELGGYDFEEEIGNETGRASGWATPKLTVESPDGAGSPGKRAILGEGMLVRADSRDNLMAGVEARINRSRSPAIRSGLGKPIPE